MLGCMSIQVDCRICNRIAELLLVIPAYSENSTVVAVRAHENLSILHYALDKSRKIMYSKDVICSVKLFTVAMLTGPWC